MLPCGAHFPGPLRSGAAGLPRAGCRVTARLAMQLFLHRCPRQVVTDAPREGWRRELAAGLHMKLLPSATTLQDACQSRPGKGFACSRLKLHAWLSPAPVASTKRLYARCPRRPCSSESLWLAEVGSEDSMMDGSAAGGSSCRPPAAPGAAGCPMLLLGDAWDTSLPL